MSNSVLRFFHWIAALFRRERVPYEPIAVTFPAVDVLRYRSQLDLDNDGARNGSHNSPASESATFDIIEQRIVTAIESERNTAQEIYLSNLRAYGDRLTRTPNSYFIAARRGR